MRLLTAHLCVCFELRSELSNKINIFRTDAISGIFKGGILFGTFYDDKNELAKV